MTEQPPSAEALNLVDRLRKPQLTNVGPGSYWHELNLFDAGKAIDALIARRVSAERERIAAAFKIPVLALTARPGEITEADKAWADGVIRARAERPAPEGPQQDGYVIEVEFDDGDGAQRAYDAIERLLGEMGQLGTLGMRPLAPAAVVDYTERAREVIALVENCAGDTALLVGAVAAEFSAATVAALERMWSAAEKQEQLEAEITALKRAIGKAYADALHVKATLLARLREPAVRGAVIDALMTTKGWVSAFPWESRLAAAALTDAALTKIAEMLK